MAWVQEIEGAKGTSFRVFWKAPSGRVASKTFSRQNWPPPKKPSNFYFTSQNAKRWGDEQESSALLGTYLDPRKGQMTYASLFAEWLMAIQNESSGFGKAPRTQSHYRYWGERFVLPYFAPFRLAQIERAHIRSWLRELEAQGVTHNLRNRAVTVLQSSLSYAVENDFIASHPATRLRLAKPKRQSEARRLSPEELLAVLCATPDRYRLLTAILGLLGLRIGEALALEIRDIDVSHHAIWVRRSVAEIEGKMTPQDTTKTGTSHLVQVPEVLWQALLLHVERYSNPENPQALIFPSTRGTHMHPSGFRARVFYPACKRAGIAEPYPHVHDLRGTAVSIMHLWGLGPKELQDLLGHASFSMTADAYLRVLPQMQQDSLVRIDERIRELLPKALTEGSE